jgi:hypothetical protein
MYTKMLLMSWSTPSMNLWKLVGHLRRPMGDVIQWNWTFPGIVKTELLGFFVQLHLLEACHEVQGIEDVGVSTANVADAFLDFLHGVFVDVRVLVQFSEVLDDPESLALFLWNAENG